MSPRAELTDPALTRAKSPYTIVQEVSIVLLEHNVNELVREGYVPLGGVNVHYGEKACQTYYTQALFFDKESRGLG